MVAINQVYLNVAGITQGDRVKLKIVGERIARRRTDLGLSQEELAERSGIDQPQLSRYEKGENVPTISTLLKLAPVLDCTIGYLVGAEPTPRPPEPPAPLSGLSDDELTVLRNYKARVLALQEEVVNEGLSKIKEPFRATVSVLLRQILEREGKFNNLRKKG